MFSGQLHLMAKNVAKGENPRDSSVVLTELTKVLLEKLSMENTKLRGGTKSKKNKKKNKRSREQDPSLSGTLQEPGGLENTKENTKQNKSNANVCYQNAALQSMLSITAFRDMLSDPDFQEMQDERTVSILRIGQAQNRQAHSGAC